MGDRKIAGGLTAADAADALQKGTTAKAPWVQAGMTEEEWRRGKAQNQAEKDAAAGRHSHPTADDVGIVRR